MATKSKAVAKRRQASEPVCIGNLGVTGGSLRYWINRLQSRLQKKTDDRVTQLGALEYAVKLALK